MEVIFQATARNLCVCHTTGEVAQHSPSGRVVYVPRRPVQFEDFRKVLDDSDPDQEASIRMLRKAKGNKANGGNSFFEVPSEVLAFEAEESGGSFSVEPDDGVTENDLIALRFLNKLPSSLPKNTFNKALDYATHIYDRYKISGVVRPKASMKQKVLRATVQLIIDAIEERGIWDGENPTGKKHSGEGQEEDQG